LANERRQRVVPALLWRKFRLGIASVIVKSEHLGEQPSVLPRRLGLREEFVELAEFNEGVVDAREPRCSL